MWRCDDGMQSCESKDVQMCENLGRLIKLRVYTIEVEVRRNAVKDVSVEMRT